MKLLDRILPWRREAIRQRAEAVTRALLPESVPEPFDGDAERAMKFFWEVLGPKEEENTDHELPQ
jgi:hypothetical protein